MSFRLKTIIGVAVIEGCLLLFLVWSSVRYLERSSEDELALRAQITAESLANLTRDAVLATDLARLESVARRTLQSPDVVYLRIMDTEHLLTAVGSEAVLARPFAADASLEAVEDGVFDVGVDLAEGDYRFGRIELGLSVARANALIADAEQHLAGIAVAEMLLVALFSYLLGAYLTRGLRNLTAAAGSISGGALGTCVEVKGADELAVAGRAFNQMSLRLAESQREMECTHERGVALASRLAEKELRLATILDAAVDGFITIDQHGFIDDINSAGAALFGYRSAELVGRNVSCLMLEPHRAAHDGYLRRYAETGEARVIGRGRRVEGLRRDGSTFPMDLSVSEMQAGGQRMFVGLVRDLSGQLSAEAAARKSEAMRSAIVDANLDALVTIDARDRIVEFSAVAEQVFGHTREQVLGQSMGELLIPPHMREMHASGMRRYLETGEGPVIGNRVEVPALRADGSTFPAELTVQAIDIDGERYFTALIRDISDRKAEERALLDARDQAEAASEAKSRFLAHMSHEIRSPLNAALGSLGLLLEGDLSKDQRLYAKTAQASSRILLSLINDILDFSKIEAERVVLEDADFAVCDLVAETMDLVAFKARDKGLVAAAAVAVGVTARVRGDEPRLRQILTNLLDNALKFTEAGVITLAVEQLGQTQGTVTLRFVVEDTGIGIPEEARAGLFDEFQQVDSSDSARHGGTGLGLAICKGLADLMGGRIGVDSVPGRGSRFSLEVPFARAEGEPEARGAEPGRAAPRVLAVGFDPRVAEVLDRLCASLCCETRFAPDVDAALAALSVGVDAVVASNALPCAALDTLAEHVRGRGTHWLVLLAAGMDPAAMQRVAHGQYDDLLVSPLLLHEMAQSLAGTDSAALPGGGDTASRPTPASNAARGGRILLAEDSPANQLVASAMLTRLGFAVDVAGDGREAVARFAAGGHDLVLMDLRMPELDGLEATAAIRALPGGDRVPIVAMTANAMREDVERCLAGGMDAFVAKPVDRAQLAETLARHLPSDARAADAPPAPQTAPGSALIDEAAARQLAQDVGEAAAPGMMQMFVDEAATRVARLTEALGGRDPGVVEDEAHTLKSCAATFGAVRLHALARDIEAACREGELAHVDDLAQGIAPLLEETLAAYRERFGVSVGAEAGG